MSSLLKAAVTRYRPYAYGPGADFDNPDIAASFPSRHTMVAFSSAVFAGYVFGRAYPDSPWRPVVWAGGLGLATVTAVFRVTSGEHFVSDTLAGAALGALGGFLIPLLHEPAQVRGPGTLSLLPTGDGLVVSLRY